VQGDLSAISVNNFMCLCVCQVYLLCFGFLLLTVEVGLMATVKARRAWRVIGAVLPLIAVIIAALIWSSFATYHHAVGPKVPGGVAWTLIAVLDGTVIVTTPIWLSTVLPSPVRNYAAVICVGALLGSMKINYDQTSWIGIFPPLIAGLLIHLVGVTLRAHAKLVLVEDTIPVVEVAPAVVKKAPALVEVAKSAPVSVKKPEKTSEISAFEIVSRMMNEAYAKGWPEPTGPELTEAVRQAGHVVNNEFGRTTKARWKKQRERVKLDG
jgi:hypothetical protein